MICSFKTNRAYFGDALEFAYVLPDESINCIMTSPPYWGLRDYGCEGQWGLELTPDEYVERMTVLFRELRRALRTDGTCWINIGDTYVSNPAKGGSGPGGKHGYGEAYGRRSRPSFRRDRKNVGDNPQKSAPGLKPKDLVGIPWMLAFSLRDDGWWLRSENIWHKPNTMPEAVKDRPTKAHEHIFLFTKNERYWYDKEAVKVPSSDNTHARGHGVNPKALAGDHPRNIDCRYQAPGQPEHTGLRKRGLRAKQNPSFSAAVRGPVATRNLRSVWTIHTQPYSGAHYATFPEALATTCILAGCPPDGVVLDPFIGSGTTGQVAQRLGRNWIGFDIDPKNKELIDKRTAQQGLFGNRVGTTGS